MRLKSLTSVFLAFTILSSSFPAVAEDDFIDKLNNFQDGQGPIHKNIARPLTRYALKKMGTPGFVISKYMTFRKHLNQPTCPLSKQLHFYANMLNLAGDITNYVLTIKHSRDLRKEFSQKSEAMTAYLSSTKDLLKAPRESGEKFDVQLMALDYSIKSEELNLERQKIKRMFTYPAISMIFIASIMNAQEALATTTSLGATAASENSCLSKDKIRREKENTAAQKIADEQAKVASEEGAKDPLDPPWYIKPFMWLAGKGREIGDGMRKIGRNVRESEVSKFANENRKALDTAREKNIGEYGGIGPLNSANYCEEMIVGLISGMQKNKHTGSAEKALVRDLSNVGIRFLVRKAVKANLEAVDALMRSPVGRSLVYAYTVRILYTEVEQIRTSIQNTKTKISALKEVRESFKDTPTNTSTDQEKVFREFSAIYSSVLRELMADAYAADELLSAQEIKLCLGVEQCQSSADFLTPELKHHLGILPKSVAKSQIDLISKSYTVAQFNRFRKGVDPIQKFDLNRVQDEILKYEGQAEKLSSALINRKLLTPASFDGFEKQTVEKDYAWYAPEMKPGFADVKLASSNFGNIPLPLPIDITETSTSDLLEEFKTEENGDAKKVITADDDPNDLRASMEKKYQESMDSEYEFEDVHKKTSNSIWDIISKRYKLRYTKEIGD